MPRPPSPLDLEPSNALIPSHTLDEYTEGNPGIKLKEGSIKDGSEASKGVALEGEASTPDSVIGM